MVAWDTTFFSQDEGCRGALISQWTSAPLWQKSSPEKQKGLRRVFGQQSQRMESAAFSKSGQALSALCYCNRKG